MVRFKYEFNPGMHDTTQLEATSEIITHNTR